MSKSRFRSTVDIWMDGHRYKSGEWVKWRHWQVVGSMTASIETDKVIFLQYYPDKRQALIWRPGNKNTSLINPITMFPVEDNA